jgi:excinuclease ABC subunit A
MNFLPDVYVPCEVCRGARYNRETLEVHYKGRTIAEVLDMPIEEACGFFEAIPAIHRHLRTLVDVGLGYVRLGQPAPTLSGGEAQRVKLASELQKRSTGRTVYVLDEPTTGLHFEDIRKLLLVLHSLVDKGNTVIVIEHNLDVIKTSDWVIDMGPAGGHKGGLLVAAGTPEEIAEVPESHTGAYLRHALELTGEASGNSDAVARAAKANGSKVANGTAAAAAKATGAVAGTAAAVNGRSAAKATAARAGTAAKATGTKATPTKAAAAKAVKKAPAKKAPAKRASAGR